MGLRSFAARRLALFLLRHGDLDNLVRIRAEEQCGSSTVATVPLWTILAGAHRRVRELELDPHHVAALWAASLAVAFWLWKEKERNGKHGKLGSSSARDGCARLLAALDATPLVSSMVAACLATFLIITFLIKVCMANTMGAHEAMATAELAGKYLFVASLQWIFTSVLLVGMSVVWGFLDPRIASAPSSSGIRAIMAKQKKGATWRASLSNAFVNAARTAAFVVSAASILYLAHAHLPLLRHALRGEVDLGLPPGASNALSQTAFSFLGFCLFSKLLPRPAGSAAPEGTRKTKKYVHDPALVKRMNMLAQEAMENVQKRKEAKKKLTRTYSDGNLLGKIKSASPSVPTYSELNLRPIVLNPKPVVAAPSPSTPPRRRNSGARPSLAPLPEHEASLLCRHGRQNQNAQWPLTSTKKAPPTKKAPRVALTRRHSPNGVADFPLAAPAPATKQGEGFASLAAADSDSEDESFRAFQKFLDGSQPKPEPVPSMKRTMSMGCFVPVLAEDEDPFEF